LKLARELPIVATCQSLAVIRTREFGPTISVRLNTAGTPLIWMSQFYASANSVGNSMIVPFRLLMPDAPVNALSAPMHG
jgi:hypothetical protein